MFETLGGESNDFCYGSVGAQKIGAKKDKSKKRGSRNTQTLKTIPGCSLVRSTSVEQVKETEKKIQKEVSTRPPTSRKKETNILTAATVVHTRTPFLFAGGNKSGDQMGEKE